jgi:hypothetical protein
MDEREAGGTMATIRADIFDPGKAKMPVYLSLIGFTVQKAAVHRSLTAPGSLSASPHRTCPDPHH